MKLIIATLLASVSLFAQQTAPNAPVAVTITITVTPTVGAAPISTTLTLPPAAIQALTLFIADQVDTVTNADGTTATVPRYTDAAGGIPTLLMTHELTSLVAPLITQYKTDTATATALQTAATASAQAQAAAVSAGTPVISGK